MVVVEEEEEEDVGEEVEDKMVHGWGVQRRRMDGCVFLDKAACPSNPRT